MLVLFSLGAPRERADARAAGARRAALRVLFKLLRARFQDARRERVFAPRALALRRRRGRSARGSDGRGSARAAGARPRGRRLAADLAAEAELLAGARSRARLRRAPGCSAGRPAISVAMRLRSCSAKWGVEAPISWRTSSTRHLAGAACLRCTRRGILGLAQARVARVGHSACVHRVLLRRRLLARG